MESESYETLSLGEEDTAIFMLYTIRVENEDFNLFFDSGCGGSVVTKDIVDRLQRLKRAKTIVSGPLVLSGVGDVQSVCRYGRYQVTIPLPNGKKC